MYCPRCGEKFVGHPALSRRDNKTDICSTCGENEAIFDWACHNYRSQLESERKVKGHRVSSMECLKSLDKMIEEERAWLKRKE